jgi:hypothetical protein
MPILPEQCKCGNWLDCSETRRSGKCHECGIKDLDKELHRRRMEYRKDDEAVQLWHESLRIDQP